MSLGTSNRDGGKTSESGHLRALAKITSGDIIEGLAVSQRGAGANMSVDIAIGDAFLRRSDGSYAHPAFNDAVYNQVITTADGSNPRRDIVVMYLDYGQAPSTAVSNNTNGVVKIKVVTGTPAGSPVDPNAAAIQSSVGAGNPYTILGRVRVPAGQTSITNSLIDDLRVLIYAKTNSVPTAAVQDSAITELKMLDGAATTRKMKPTYSYTAGSTGGARQSVPNAWTNISGAVASYTSGATPEVLWIFGSCIANATAPGSQFLIGVNGTPVGKSDYDDQAGTFKGRFGGALYNIPANTTVTIALMGKAASGTVAVGNAAADVINNYSPSLSILAFGR